MRTNLSLAGQFKAAYKAMVESIEDGRIRFKGPEKEKLALRLEDSRKAFVESYQQMNLRVRDRYRGIEKDVYEKEHPGRIDAQKMKVSLQIARDGAAPLYRPGHSLQISL